MFGYTYCGSGRLTGQYCPAPHTWEPPSEPGQVGAWVGRDGCAHNETDGREYGDGWDQDVMDAFWNEFICCEHDQIGHPDINEDCPLCIEGAN